MARVIWNFKKWLATERDIYRPSELQALLLEKTGVHISIQSLSTLINHSPDALRMKTLTVICDALDCRISDFFDVLPEPADVRQQKMAVNEPPRQLYGSKQKTKQNKTGTPSKNKKELGENIFPSPYDED